MPRGRRGAETSRALILEESDVNRQRDLCSSLLGRKNRDRRHGLCGSTSAVGFPQWSQPTRAPHPAAAQFRSGPRAPRPCPGTGGSMRQIATHRVVRGYRGGEWLHFQNHCRGFKPKRAGPARALSSFPSAQDLHRPLPLLTSRLESDCASTEPAAKKTLDFRTSAEVLNESVALTG